MYEAELALAPQKCREVGVRCPDSGERVSRDFRKRRLPVSQLQLARPREEQDGPAMDPGELGRDDFHY